MKKRYLRKIFTLELLSINPNFDYPFHWHNAIELVYVVENPFEVFVNNRRYNLSDRDIIFIPGGDIHGFHTGTNTGKRIFANFDTYRIGNEIGFEPIKDRLKSVQLITPENNPWIHQEIENEINRAMEEYNDQAVGYQMSLAARAVDILVKLYRNTDNVVNFESKDSNVKKISGLEKMSKAFKFIEENYNKDIGLSDVANAAGFSKYYFSRLFKDIAEKNFNEYCNEFRIKKAERMLMNINKSIAVVAYSSGFSSLATFERSFKKIQGCTPLEYRKMGI
jgi:AraC-like DNA-binding protein/uncharacterized cupin superfamily protein